jgi:hypothetical protein
VVGVGNRLVSLKYIDENGKLNIAVSGHSTVAVCKLPKLETRVRSPLSAHVYANVAFLVHLNICQSSSTVEQSLRKGEVGGSSPLSGSSRSTGG